MNSAFSGLVVRPARRDRAHLPADCGQLPVVGRSVRHHYRTAGALAGIVWMLFVTQHDALRAGADGRDHVHGRCHREQRTVISFARERSAQRGDATAAALEAGFVRSGPF